MTQPLTFAPKPKVGDEIKQQALQYLREAIEKVEAGEVEELIILLRMPNRHWLSLATDSANFTQAMGALEILKHEWIAKYLAEQ